MVEVVYCWFGCWLILSEIVRSVRVDFVFTDFSVHLIEFGFDFVVCDKPVIVRVQLLHELLNLLIRQVFDVRIHGVWVVQAQRNYVADVMMTG
jgi:hypothetical protein